MNIILTLPNLPKKNTQQESDFHSVVQSCSYQILSDCNYELVKKSPSWRKLV